MLGEWQMWAAGRGLLPTTIETYERVLRRLQAERGELERLDEGTIAVWLVSLDGAPATQDKRRAALRNYYEFLIRTKRRRDDPTAALDRYPIATRRAGTAASPPSRI